MGNVLCRYEPEKFIEALVRHGASQKDASLIGWGRYGGNLFYELGLLYSDEFYRGIRIKLGLRGMSHDDFFKYFSDTLIPDAGMVSLLGELKRCGVALGLVSNTNACHADMMRERYPEVFENFRKVILSQEAYWRKPKKTIFRIALNKLGERVERTMLIDDRIENIDSFREMGGAGYHFRSGSGDVNEFWREWDLFAEFLSRTIEGFQAPEDIIEYAR